MAPRTIPHPRPRCACGAPAVYGIGGMIYYCPACLRRVEALASSKKKA